MSHSPTTAILVHGAFADASGWQRLIPLLLRDGLDVVAVQCPLTSLADDVAATRRALDAAPGPVVLVGHSYGGAVMTGAAAGRANVRALVYVAAFAPDAGDTLGGLLGRFEPSDLLKALVPDSGGFLSIERARYREVFAHDLPSAETRVLAATQKPIHGAIFDQSVDAAAWREIPSWYLVATGDRAIRPELQHFLALRIRARTAEVEASHVPFLSQPERVAAVVRDAVRASSREQDPALAGR